MNDVAIFALMTGINYCSILHGIEENTLKDWIKNIDLDHHSFFVKMREYIVSNTKKIGIEKASSKFGVSIETLEIMMKEFDFQTDDNKETKKKAIKYFLAGLPYEKIIYKLNITYDQLEKWINTYNLASKKPKIKVENVTENDCYESSQNTQVLVKEEDISTKQEVLDQQSGICVENVEKLKDEFDEIIKNL